MYFVMDNASRSSGNKMKAIEQGHRSKRPHWTVCKRWNSIAVNFTYISYL